MRSFCVWMIIFIKTRHFRRIFVNLMQFGGKKRETHGYKRNLKNKSADWKWNRFKFPLKAHFDLSNLFKRILVALQCKNKSFVDHLTEPFSHRCGRIEIGAPLNYNEKLSSLWILSDSIVHRSHVYQSICNEFPIMMFSIVR